MKLEPARIRFNVAPPRQQPRRQNFAITQAFPDANGHLFYDSLAWSLLQQTNQRFDSRVELDLVLLEHRLSRIDPPQPGEETKIGEPGDGGQRSAPSHECPPVEI